MPGGGPWEWGWVEFEEILLDLSMLLVPVSEALVPLGPSSIFLRSPGAGGWLSLSQERAATARASRQEPWPQGSRSTTLGHHCQFWSMSTCQVPDVGGAAMCWTWCWVLHALVLKQPRGEDGLPTQVHLSPHLMPCGLPGDSPAERLGVGLPSTTTPVLRG